MPRRGLCADLAIGSPQLRYLRQRLPGRRGLRRRDVYRVRLRSGPVAPSWPCCPGFLCCDGVVHRARCQRRSQLRRVRGRVRRIRDLQPLYQRRLHSDFCAGTDRPDLLPWGFALRRSRREIPATAARAATGAVRGRCCNGVCGLGCSCMEGADGECSAGQTCRQGVCADLAVDPAQCGACGAACARR